MVGIKSIGRWLAPPAQKGEDGRDLWPSRTAFILASCGGAVGMGNVLRYPSQVFNNHGLQWFVPYLMAVFLLAIPALILEISVGQAYRAGCVVSYNNLSNRLKGVGLGLNMIGFSVVVYFVPILAWVMVYFRHSFYSPLPWDGGDGGSGTATRDAVEDFYNNKVIANTVVEGELSEDTNTILSWYQYPDMSLNGEVTGWNAFTWFIVWLCMFRGVGLTGRVVYFTMGIPIITIIILIGRGVSLENATEGIKLYFATWRGDTLASGGIWQTACGQVFFSTGVGFGYYTSYASYNAKMANAVQDSFFIVCFNTLFEVLAAFSVFGVVGNLRLFPGPEENEQTSFSIGFKTYPAAIVQMPGANFWALLFFFTLMLLGISSSFAMLDAVVTLIMDTHWGGKISRPIVSTAITIGVFLLSLMYCTKFGSSLLDGVDAYISDMALVFVVWSECVSATTVYRWKDVAREVGLPAFIIYNVGYFGATIFGLVVAHTVTAAAGAGFAFGWYIVATIIAVVVSKTPESRAPRFWGKSKFVSRFWYLAFYSVRRLHWTESIGLSMTQD